MKRVLVIDDSITCYELLREILKNVFSNMEVRQDANSALYYLANNGVDLVFLDVVLPGLSGLEVLKRIKNLRPEVPVIIYSADARTGSIKEALSLGAEAYLTKPLSIQELYSALGKLDYQLY